MRCPDCNKFVGLDFQDPEWESEPEINGGQITGTVRLVRCCADCGGEMKEARLEVDLETGLPDGHEGEGHELTVEMDDLTQLEKGGGRYAKSYFGAEAHWTVRCSCQQPEDKPLAEGDWSDQVAASEMDELY